MKNYFKLLILFLLIAVSAINTSAEEIISVATYEDNLKEYRLFLAEKEISPLDIHDFSSYHSSRVVASLILIQQALHLGGGDYTIEFVSAPNPSRALSFVKTGKAVLLGDDMWNSNFDESVYKSSEIIGSGEFEKIIVGRLDNTQLMQVKSLNDLQKFSVVTGHDWHVDIKTLQEMKINYLNKVPVYNLQFNLLTAGRVDFTMFEACNLKDENKAELKQMNLAIVQGIKIGLIGSRHFMVSKKHPLGKQVFETLERGLKILREKGLIRKAMIDVGFFNEKVSEWKKIYPAE